ncbi:MAG: hypothetical protein VZS44_01075 [Bacilli bacterium]|nr:hypothetical protein [Bacilli bacterium]
MMNGKELKVSELEMKFGQNDRMVNVFGVFRYRPNNSLYVIYADVGTTYDYVCFGSSHIKNNVILSMNSNKAEDMEVIKEYIYKVVNNEPLDNFEIYPLDNIDEIELIASKNFELRREVLESLIEKTIPKKAEDSEEVVVKSTKKKKSPILTILLLLLLIVVGGAGFLFYTTMMEAEETYKFIYCKTSYDHEELKNVLIEEEDRYEFNNSDKLVKVRVTLRYNFVDENSYLDFKNNNRYFSYMVENNKHTTGSFDLDDENNSFVTFADTVVDEAYENSVDYEEILSLNTKDGYSCEEKIEK